MAAIGSSLSAGTTVFNAVLDGFYAYGSAAVKGLPPGRWATLTLLGVNVLTDGALGAVSDEVEKRLEQGMMQLKPSDWKCGDRPWLVELGAIPAVAADEKAIGALLSGLARTVFPLTGYRAIWSNAKTGKREVISVGLQKSSGGDQRE